MPDNKNGECLRALILGDIVGKSGCRTLFLMLKTIIKKTKADFVIVNGENADSGSGMTPEIVKDFFNSGVDIITSGNHIWHKKEIYPLLESENHLLRPANYPKGVPGHGDCTFNIKGHKVSVLNLQGNVNNFIRLYCPFIMGKKIARRLKKESNIIIVDFHAELPQEKEALAIYLDGEVSAVFGTHTHVQTADEKILPGGTGYITDIGMTGPDESVIGLLPEIAIKRVYTQMSLKMEIAENPAIIMGIILDLDVNSGKTLSIKRITERSKL